MKQSDMLWMQSFAQGSNGQGLVTHPAEEILLLSQGEFLDDTYALLVDLIHYLESGGNPFFQQSPSKVFKVGSFKPGIMIVRGSDKLLVSSSFPQQIVGKLMTADHTEDGGVIVFSYQAQMGEDGEVLWRLESKSNSQSVNMTPDLCVKKHLSQFLLRGATVFQ